ncbi:uncharacterized protein Z520_00689 [Fonsecaea multimorphosa CBS 102226]|uniref:Rhodopsin domain-containing protein n=1 Tax=Fonsecaea multimorphosa CBS 102226 TaxID=1442371 RepID=A0A0D2J3N8_9EURO|nr:uncharacterized protein Z520_00689 [Fonsecaea multimorphosa CBS 102226]KIY03997.1 hypothetical protein Z520_00689 [Fonsecaea multimorphosa CBS 102226]OAL31835.1 hypothetical protein AYO22_00705 [Fonsecaea multimorphosa]
MADSSTSDPTIEGNRYFRVTPSDHRGVILVVSVICAAYVPMLLALRGTFTNKTVGLDDGLAIGVAVVGLLHSILVWIAVSHGLGRSYADIGASDASSMGRMLVASIVLFLITLFLTKTCVILLCRKLFSINMKRHRTLCDTMTVICGLWCVGAILALTIDCSSIQQLGYHTSFCPTLTKRWSAVAVVDGITEILIFLLSLAVVLPLHMSTDRKVSVLLTFAPRLAVIALIGLHAHYIDLTVHSRNPGVEIVTPVVYRQVLVLFAMASAALPALNRGLRKFNTSMGSTWMETTVSQASGGKATNGQASIPLKSMKTNKSSMNRSKRRSMDEDEIDGAEKNPNFRPDKVQHNTTAYWGKSVDPDARSGQSQESQNSEAKIIRKDMQWRVHYENQGPS